jgi:hypothetical protein
MPANLGVANAMWISRSLHAIAAACMVGAWSIDARFAAVFGVATGIVIALLMLEHLTVARWGTTRMALAFFTVNGIISCVAGLLGIVDVLV